jgi:hypothetical protein
MAKAHPHRSDESYRGMELISLITKMISLRVLLALVVGGLSLGAVLATAAKPIVPETMMPTCAVFMPVISSTPSPPIRAVGVSYARVSDSRAEVSELRAQMIEAGVTMVGLTAGRPDWTYFKWETHPESWSSAVRATDIDFLAEDSDHFGFGHINAIVDIYAPTYIAAHPEAAAISFWGEPSPLLVSTASLTSGPFHDHVLDMLGYLAGHYPIDSISITELAYRIYGYGPDDLALYQAYTGQDDWPRDRDGNIRVDHPAIGTWRSAALAAFLEEAAARVHAHGVELFLDVSVSWGNLENEGREYGHHYATVLQAVDRVIVWGYTDLAGYRPTYAGEIAAYLAEHYRSSQVILSIGLWGQGQETMTPTTLAEAVASTVVTRIPHTWITPTYLMTEAHWQALIKAWER